jgi:hypothetical protein
MECFHPSYAGSGLGQRQEFSDMKRFHDSRFARRVPAGVPDRRGSTIVVVIALLLALTFLGIVGYTIGTQEHSNASYFLEAHKSYEPIGGESLFDFGLRQLILGTRLEERQSALHGGQLSLLPTMFGWDMAPYSGEGVNLVMDASGDIFVDQNYDTMDDNDDTLLELNRAPFSRDPADLNVGAVDQSGYPSPDAGYTYWDNNSPFLAYVNKDHLYDPNLYDPNNPVRLFIPSFHRPQYLRSRIFDPASNQYVSVAANAWYTDPLTQRRVLRPHAGHRAVDKDGNVTNVPRFVSHR